jgi:hypothetical protein
MEVTIIYAYSINRLRLALEADFIHLEVVAKFFDIIIIILNLRDFRLPPRWRWDRRSSGTLRRVEW